MELTITIKLPDNEAMMFADRLGKSIAENMNRVPTVQSESEFMSREEYAEMRGVTPATISKWFHKGVVKGRQYGKKGKISIYRNQLKAAV